MDIHEKHLFFEKQVSMKEAKIRGYNSSPAYSSKKDPASKTKAKNIKSGFKWALMKKHFH